MSYRVANEWTSITWRLAGERVRRIANGLLADGLETESRVCIICQTRVEWVLADLAIVCAGGATTTIYPSTPAEDCRFILNDSGTVVVFAENDAQVAKLTSQRDQLEQVRMVVVIDGKPSA
ncbi:MAG: long-chain acyl-CoA synthetase, partial [Kiritimatiellia bacterium]